MVVNPAETLATNASPPSDDLVGRDGGLGGAGEAGEGKAASRMPEQYLLKAAGSMLGGLGGTDLEGDEVGRNCNPCGRVV